jgi:homoaconitase/3-isopropylmalate dehydratase large subunit
VRLLAKPCRPMGARMFDEEIVKLNAADIAPQVTWGTSPEDVVPITGHVPSPEDCPEGKRETISRAWTTWA